MQTSAGRRKRTRFNDRRRNSDVTAVKSIGCCLHGDDACQQRCRPSSACVYMPILRLCIIYTDRTGKVKSNYFIVRPKVDQRTGLLSLPHLRNFRRTHAHHICLYFVSIHQRAITGAQRCAPLVRLLTTHLPTPEGWKAELA